MSWKAWLGTNGDGGFTLNNEHGNYAVWVHPGDYPFDQGEEPVLPAEAWIPGTWTVQLFSFGSTNGWEVIAWGLSLEEAKAAGIAAARLRGVKLE